MKARLFLLAILPVLLFSCYACPGNWSDFPHDFTITLDRYEAKVGDEITMNSGDVKVFDEDFKLCCEYYVSKDGKIVENTSEEIFEIKTYYVKDIKKIDSTHAKFKVPADLPNTKLEIRTSFTQKEENSCSSGTWYGTGYLDKSLTITQ